MLVCYLYNLLVSNNLKTSQERQGLFLKSLLLSSFLLNTAVTKRVLFILLFGNETIWVLISILMPTLTPISEGVSKTISLPKVGLSARRNCSVGNVFCPSRCGVGDDHLVLAATKDFVRLAQGCRTPPGRAYRIKNSTIVM